MVQENKIPPKKSSKGAENKSGLKKTKERLRHQKQALEKIIRTITKSDPEH